MADVLAAAGGKVYRNREDGTSVIEDEPQQPEAKPVETPQ